MLQERNPHIIEIKDLKIGCAYHGIGHNFNTAIWTGKAFAGLRHKFGNKFIDEELHWDAERGAGVKGTFQPLWIMQPVYDD